MKPARLHACVFAFILIVASGCSSYRDPAIDVSGVTLAEATDEAFTLRFDMHMVNPNAEPLKLLEFDYDVMVNGVKAYSGTRAAESTLAANGAKHVTIPAVVRFEQINWPAGAIPAETNYSIAGNLQYVTPGEIAQILFDAGVRRPRAGFRGDGAVTLK